MCSSRRFLFKGFSIIEPLAVIVIVMALVSILFPVLVRAKVRAQRTKRSENLEQIYDATTLYLADYEDRYPNAVMELERQNLLRDGGVVRSETTSVLAPYGKTRKIFHCPVDDGAPDRNPPVLPSFYVRYLSSHFF